MTIPLLLLGLFFTADLFFVWAVVRGASRRDG
jgi:hypothetical protein